MPVPRLKCCLPLVALLNAKLIVRIAEVKFCKDFRLREAVQHLAHEWDRVAVLDSDFVEATVINTQPYRAICLWYKKNRRTRRRLAWSYPALLLRRIEVFPKDIQLTTREVIDREVRYLFPFLNVNGIIILSVGSKAASLPLAKRLPLVPERLWHVAHLLWIEAIIDRRVDVTRLRTSVAVLTGRRWGGRGSLRYLLVHIRHNPTRGLFREPV